MRSVRVSTLERIVVTRRQQGGAGRRPASDGTSNPLAALHRTGRPTHWPPCIGRDVQPTGRPASDGTSNPHVGRAKVGRASRARLPGILPGSDGINDAWIAPLAMRAVRGSLLGRIVVTRPKQGGAGRRPASDETSNPLAALHRTGRPTHWPPCIGRDVQPTGRPASNGTSNPQSGSRTCGSRVSREAPRHPAGERWHQQHVDRTSRDAGRSGIASRDDRRNSPKAGRRGTPPCIGRDVQPTGRPASDGRPTHRVGRAQVGRASRARLPGILPGSDGINNTWIVPLAMRAVRGSRLGTIVATRPKQGGAGRRPASDGTSNPLAALHRTGRPTHKVGRAQVGRASRARLPGILPGSDGINDTWIAPLAMRAVRVSTLERIVVTRPKQGGAGRRPDIGRDVQPTGRPASDGTSNPLGPNHWVPPIGWRRPDARKRSERGVMPRSSFSSLAYDVRQPVVQASILSAA